MSRKPHASELPRIPMREGLLRRLPPTASSDEALDLLQQKLAQSTLRMESFGDGGHFGVSLAINALIEFLTSQGIPYATARPIVAIQAALVDATRGVESDVFRPRRSGGGAPPTPALKLEFDGMLAVITECCIQQARKEGFRAYMVEGTKQAARLIGRSNWPVKPTHTELRELRERIRALRHDRLDKQTYWNLIQSPVAKERPMEWARLLLKHEWVGLPVA